MKLTAGQIVAERYEIDDVIGSGGMSVVYRAHDKKLDRYVTLKVLKEDYLADENLTERFPKEARAAAALNHQNIVSIFDHGRDEDIFYIVLEYVDGASLKELINKKAPFDDETNLAVTIQVSEGLAEAHRNNIIHLDVKPQNILVTTTSIVKVADFGIARAAKSVTVNAAAGSMGSVHYFSPEQARGGYIDHKSDIYSLGIVMYEMATGELPFEGENEIAVALQHINDPLPDIAKINPSVSESVIKIIKKATEKSASKRYQNIDDMTEDLKRALTDASGTFVATEPPEEKSPTRTRSGENREAVRKQKQNQSHNKKLRTAFLDGVETPDDDYDDYDDEEENPNEIKLISSRNMPRREPLRVENYQEGQQYVDYNGEYYDDYTPPPLKPVRNKKADRMVILGGSLFGLLLAAIIALFAWHFFVNTLSGTAGMIPIPAVEGLSWADAEAHIRVARLTPYRMPDVFCGDTVGGNFISCGNIECGGECTGTVIFQDPVADTMASPRDGDTEGDFVRMAVSRGAAGAPVSVPRFEGLTQDDAIQLLHDLGLLYEIIDYEDEGLPRGIIHMQYPEPNEVVPRGTVVELHISLGPDDGLVQMPLIVGLREVDALMLLGELSLVGNATPQASDTFGAGFVMRQDVNAGEWVERNTIVPYVVSSGRATPLPTPTPTPPANEGDVPTNGNDDTTPGDGGTPTPTPSPSPTPTPTPTPPANGDDTPATPAPPTNGGDTQPIPTPTPPATDGDTPPALQSGTITIHLNSRWSIPEGTQTVDFVIQRQMGESVDIFTHVNIPVASFPLTVPVEYSGTTIFRILQAIDGNFSHTILIAEENRS